MNREEIKLLPCPFCGGESFATGYVSGDTFLFKAYCSKCPATMRGFDQCQQDAVDAWNTRASAAPSDGMNHRTTAEPDQRSGHRSAEDAVLTRLAAELHRSKWQFDLSEDYQPSKSAARALIAKAFDELHRLGDLTLKLRSASAVSDHQSANSEPQEAVVSNSLPPDAGKAEPAALIEKIAAEAERYAGQYPQSSDGRNTFIMFADFVRAQLPATDEAGREISQHIGWLKQYIQGMDESNWKDMRLRAERQLEELCARSSAHEKCPHVTPPKNLSEPCQICGALGPWFDGGDCVVTSTHHPATDEAGRDMAVPSAKEHSGEAR